MLTVDGSFFEGLFNRVLKPEGAFKTKLRLAGCDVDRLEPKYEEEVFGRALRIAAEFAFPGDPIYLAHRRIGHALVEGYFETILGSVTASMIRVLGVRGTLARFAQLWHVPQPGMEISAELESPGQWLVRFKNRVMTAELVAGIVETALGRADPSARVEIVERKSGAGVLRVKILNR